MDENQQNKKRDHHRTIASLRLDLEEAQKGRTWLLLPEGFRDQHSGKIYPLPSRRLELQKLVAIYIPTNKKDSGCLYLRRALDKWRKQQARATSALLDMGRREERIKESHYNYKKQLKSLIEDARKAVDEVREEARQNVASMQSLFDLSKEGLDGLIRAYNSDEKWHGEKVTNPVFLGAVRIVTQTVKALGLGPDDRDSSTQAVLEEVAASIKETQETVALASGGDGEETEH